MAPLSSKARQRLADAPTASRKLRPSAPEAGTSLRDPLIPGTGLLASGLMVDSVYIRRTRWR